MRLAQTPGPLALALLAGTLACSGGAPARRPDARAATGPGARWGVDLRDPRRIAAGYLVEVELRVIDASLAAPLFDPAAPARLAAGAGGKVLAPVGKALGGAPLEAGRAYPMRFDNTQNAVVAGDRVTLQLGPLEVGELLVGE